jgi:hypothetical protein
MPTEPNPGSFAVCPDWMGAGKKKKNRNHYLFRPVRKSKKDSLKQNTLLYSLFERLSSHSLASIHATVC